MSIKLGNAPCSWGTIEGMNVSERLGFETMLDELVEAGYLGTELGDYGFMPTRPDALKEALVARNLTMLGAYIDVSLKDTAALEEGCSRAVRIAELLRSVADVGDPDWRPFVVLADVHSQNKARFEKAGRTTPELSLSDKEMTTFAKNATAVAKRVKDETGLKTVFHHHCAGYVETPDEVARFLERTDPELVGLVLDTGHYLYGSGDNDASLVTEALRRYEDRIEYVHFKDVEPELATRARHGGWDYKTAIGNGVFCELGRGCVDFRSVLKALDEIGYKGWATIEQDMLPGLGAPKESATRNREYIQTLVI